MSEIKKNELISIFFDEKREWNYSYDCIQAERDANAVMFYLKKTNQNFKEWVGNFSTFEGLGLSHEFDEAETREERKVKITVTIMMKEVVCQCGRKVQLVSPKDFFNEGTCICGRSLFQNAEQELLVENLTGEELKTKIIKVLHQTLKEYGAMSDMLCITGSFNDSLDDNEVLAELKEWLCEHENISPTTYDEKTKIWKCGVCGETFTLQKDFLKHEHKK